jgi:hypothetical protein
MASADAIIILMVDRIHVEWHLIHFVRLAPPRLKPQSQDGIDQVTTSNKRIQMTYLRTRDQ